MAASCLGDRPIATALDHYQGRNSTALLGQAWQRPELQPRMVASWHLVLLALGTPAYFIASFGPGMALADTYGIGGADASPWAAPLHVTSGLAVIALAGLAACNRVRDSQRHR